VAQVAVIDMAPLDTPETMSTSYMPNRFNQYVGITRPEAMEVSGVTDPAVPEVEIMVGPDDPNYAGQSTLQLWDGQTRPLGNGEPGGYGLWVKGNEFHDLGQWPLLSVTASRPGENPNDPPITQTQSGRVWVRPTEAPVHDADGNLVSDGGWTYQWDAENRLIAAEMKADDLPADLPQMRMEFHYDWLSRRVATVTQTKAPNATTWTTVETRHFWYDGWNLMAETVVSPPASGATGSVAVTHRYAWGVDLGGTWETGMGNHGPGRSQTAAGGVGALLGVIAPNTQTYSATHDANGNVMGFIDLETGTLAARFDYDAFGTLITDWSAPGHNAWEISRIRFSGKYQDPHTGWLYYGYRYLDTVNGRWVSRDPIGEEGGLNLYGMVGNDWVGRVDVVGERTLKFAFGFDATFEEEPTGALERYRSNLEFYIKKCIKLASPKKPFLGFIGKPKPPACPDLNLSDLQALGIDITSAGHFSCTKPKDGKNWTGPSDNDPNGVKDGLLKIKKKVQVKTAVLFTTAAIWGGCAWKIFDWSE
jgi:RHS repeat-associated protein